MRGAFYSNFASLDELFLALHTDRAALRHPEVAGALTVHRRALRRALIPVLRMALGPRGAAASNAQLDDVARAVIAVQDWMALLTTRDHDARARGFPDGDRPTTVNPSSWRQARLTSRHGLYEVADGIYQVRDFDIANMTLVESDHGVIVIDPLVSAETAARSSAAGGVTSG